MYYSDGIIEALDQGIALTMNGTKYVLVEFPVYVEFPYIQKAVQRLLYAGYIPIIAHVERYERIRKRTHIEELVDMGAYIQVNALRKRRLGMGEKRMNENQMMETDEIEIDLSEIFHVLLSKWKRIFLAAIVGLLLVVGITKFAITPKYQSQAMLYIISNTTTDSTTMTDLQIGATLTGDFEIIATSKAVIDASIKKIKSEEGVTFTNKEIQEMLTVTSETNTRILTIQAVSDDPEHACWVASAVAEATAERAAEIMKSDPPSLLAEAEIPEEQISPSMTKNAVIGFMLGAILVCAYLVIKTLMNDNIKTEEDVEKYLGEATLAVIPYVKNKGNKREELRRQAGNGGSRKTNKKIK